jgi:hypothetical protein
MAYEQKAGDIAVFANDKKEKDTHPDWKGTMVVPEGVGPGDKLEVAFWAKGGKGTMLAGSAKPGRQQQERQAIDTQNQSRGGGSHQGSGRWGDDGDEIPFVTSDSIT